MPESVQSSFELSIHLSVKIVRGKKIQTNVKEGQNTTGRFLARFLQCLWLIACILQVPIFLLTQETITVLCRHSMHVTRTQAAKDT